RPEKRPHTGRRPRRQTFGFICRGQARLVSRVSARSAGMHARKVGHVILRTAVDRPWSQYFCCTLAANRDYATRCPVATKRVIRAILKAADLCAAEPEVAARLIVNGGFSERYDYALQTLTENPYGAWREYDAEDTVRFYALRLHELGMIKSSPQK